MSGEQVAAPAGRGPDTASPAPVAPRPGLGAIARGGALNLLGAGASAVAGLLLVVVVTRGLPQREAGVFFALTSVFLIAQVLSGLGTGTGLVYFIARMRSLGSVERIGSFQRVALIPVVAVSVTTALVLALWAADVGRWVGARDDSLHTAVVVLAVLLPVAALSDSLLAATRGHATMLPTVVVDKAGRSLLQLGLVTLAVVVGTGSMAVLAAAWALPWVASAILAAWFLTRLGRTLRAAGPADAAVRPPWREFWTFTGPRVVSSVAQLLLQRLDIVLVSVLIGPVQAAIYTAATRFLVVGQLSSLAIANAAQPRLAELLAVGARASAKAVYQSATAWIVVMTWPLYLLCAVFADVVLAVFGPGYAAGKPVILVLAAAMLFATACGMVDMVLNMAGRTAWTMVNAVIAVAVMIGLDLLLIPRMGILGAGIGWAVAIGVNISLPLIQLRVSLGLHPFGRATLTAAALCLVCFGAVPAAARLVWPDSVLASVVAVALGVAAFAAACLRWRDLLDLPGLRAFRLRRSPVSAPAAD
jgi:O-antigen/teichoic acid export membrane protein